MHSIYKRHDFCIMSHITYMCMRHVNHSRSLSPSLPLSLSSSLSCSEHRASAERSKIEGKKAEFADTPSPETDKKLKILQEKGEALEKQKPSFKSLASPLVLYCFPYFTALYTLLLSSVYCSHHFTARYTLLFVIAPLLL